MIVTPHIESYGHEIERVLNEAPGKWFKWVNPPAQRPTGLAQGVKCLARIWTGDEVRRADLGAVGADQWWAENRGRIPGWVQAVELPDNEIYAKEHSQERIERHVVYRLRLLEHLRDARPGLKVAGGNFSKGAPELHHVPLFRPLVHKLDAFGFHSYWPPAGPLAAPGYSWLTFRYRRFWTAMGGTPQLTWITEMGCVTNDPEGWRSLGLSEDAYAAQIEQYRAEAAKDDYVEMAFLWTRSDYYPWRNQTLPASFYRRVMARNVVAPVTPSPPPPRPWPIPGARVSQQFGERPQVYGAGGHPGVDLAPPTGMSHLDWHGTPVRATVSGLAYALGDARTAYGLHCYVFGSTEDELLAHLAQTAWFGSRQVNAGDVVGWVGYTGNTEPGGVLGTHLHWGKRPNSPYRWGNGTRGYVDPLA